MSEARTGIYKLVRENKLSYNYDYDVLYYDCETYNVRFPREIPHPNNPNSVVAMI